MNKRPTQCERVLRYMRDFGEISSRDAINDLGCMRLASRISELKRRGYPIRRRMETAKNRYNEPTSYAVYYLEKEA